MLTELPSPFAFTLYHDLLLCFLSSPSVSLLEVLGSFLVGAEAKKEAKKTEAMLNVFDISEDALILPVLQKSLRENYKQLNHQEI